MQIGHSSSSSRGRLSKESDTDVPEALPPLSEAGGFVDQTGRVFIAGGRLLEAAPWPEAGAKSAVRVARV